MNVTSYDTMIREVTTLGAWCDMMHVYALSAALGVVIASYIPPVSHDTSYFTIYTRDVIGSGVTTPSPARFTLMWSAAQPPLQPDHFSVNHVVLLVSRPTAAKPRADTTASAVENCLSTDTEFSASVHDDVANTTAESMMSPSSSHTDVCSNDSASRLDNTSNDASPSSPPNAYPLPSADGLTTSKVLDLLTKRTQADIVPMVPHGAKCDVFFVVDNSRNVRRKQDKQNNVFDDDCGAWKNSAARSIKTHYT